MRTFIGDGSMHYARAVARLTRVGRGLKQVVKHRLAATPVVARLTRVGRRLKRDCEGVLVSIEAEGLSSLQTIPQEIKWISHWTNIINPRPSMKTFTVRDLQERTDELIQCAEDDRLSVVTKLGTPVFIALPFNEAVLCDGVTAALAVHLFDEEHVSLGKAAKIAGLSVRQMADLLTRHRIPIIRTTREELERSLADFR